MALRIVFMGTPDFAVPTLSEIVAAGHDVVAVLSQPPRPAGRGMLPTPSPVARFATAAGLSLMTPATLKDPSVASAIGALTPDVAVVVAYGLLLPQAVLDLPREGCLNLHASALPRWRGAAPIQRAVMAGDASTAVMVMRMDRGLDTGPVCLSERVAIGPAATAGEVHDELALLGAGLMVRALAALERGTLACRPQAQEGVTYAAKIAKEEARIDFSLPAGAVHNHIRGLSPFPGAWLEIMVGGRAERVKVLRSESAAGAGTPGTALDDALTIACGRDAIRLLRLQRSGRQAMAAEDFLRGLPIPAGTVLMARPA